MKKRIVSVLLFISMLLMSMPSVGALEIMSTPILLIDIGNGSVIIENGTAENTFKLTHGSVQTDNIYRFTFFKIFGTTTSNTITVSANSYRPNIRLDGANIDVSGTHGACAFRITSAARQVLVYLEEGSTNSLKSGYNCAGLQKENNYSNLTGENYGNDVLLTIAGAGTLYATGGNTGDFGAGGAGIGGGNCREGKHIEIRGGTVIATGGEYSAGIGGSYKAGSNHITISGGNVTANGGRSSAGIGGSYTVYYNYIAITGGTVTATGGNFGAGIGDSSMAGSYIYIKGGTVNAIGGKYSNGIGDGSGDYCKVFISGGNIKTNGIQVVPTMADGVTPVYRATFTVPGTGISTGTAVSGLNIPGYNTDNILTLDNNKVYTYLPKNTGNTQTIATYGGRLYAAQVNTAGTAAFTLVPPIISEISSPDTVKTGNLLSVTVPTINTNGFTIASQGWQLQKSGGSYQRFYPYATALDMTYNNSSLRYFVKYTDEDSTEKTVYSNEVILSVVRIDGSVSIISDISKIYDGAAVSEPVYDKLGTGTATIEYKIKDADNSTYTTTKPVHAGEYTLRVSVAEDSIYNAASNTADFTISYLAVPASPYILIPVANASGWHNTNVTITPASGYTISSSLNGIYLPSITVSESKAGYPIYLKNAAGQMTDSILVEEIKIDKEAPTNVTISYEKDGWREFLNTVTFGLFFKDTVQVKLSASDAVSGVKEFKYTLGGTEYTVTATSGSAEFSIVPQYMGNISGIKAIDNAGNESEEIVTEYFAVDSISPAAPTVNLNGYTSGTWTNSDVRFTISGATALSGIAKYQYSTDNGVNWYDIAVIDETATTDKEPYNAIVAELTVSSESDGISYIFRAVSNAGNNGAESNPVVVNIDKAVPTIDVSSDIKSYKQNDTVTITASAGISGISRVEVKKDDGSYNDITSSYSSGYTVTENGTYIFRITNGANLKATDSITYTKLDSAKPVISIDSNDYIQDTWTNGDVTLTVSNTASNLGTTTFQYSIDNANWSSYTGAITIGSDTNTAYYFKAISAAGVESNVESIVVKLDKTVPTGEITVKTKGFTSFLNTITFGLFFKNTIGITVSSEDSGSTVDTVEYYLSETALDNTTDWTSLGWTVGDSTSVTANWKGVVYARITDKAGNVSIINSDGIVAYTDSGATASASFVKNSTFDLSVPVEMNSNTMKSISYSGTALTLGTDYNVDTNAIIFKNAYLKSLADGDAVFTVEWNPFGEEYVPGNDNDVPGTTTITVSISRAEQLDTLSITGLADSYTYGDSTIHLSTEGGSGDGAVSFISSNPDVASVSGTTVTIHKAGSFTITATKAQDDVYNAKSVISDTVTVKQADPDISLDGTNVDYGNHITLTVTVSGAGAVPTGTVTFNEDSTILATVNLVNGTASYTTSTLPIAGDHSYSVEYCGQIGYYNSGTASKTIGVGKIDQAGFDFNAPPTLTYGDTGKSLTASGGQTEITPVFSVQPNDYIDIAANGAITIIGAGSVKVTAKKAGDNNYNEAVAELIVTVVPRDINLVSVNVSGSKVYTGSRLMPSFDVSDGSITITNGDYTNAYGTNITVAQGGTITLTGQKNYTGTKTVSFDILKVIPANVVFPTPAAVDYDPAKTLGDIALSGSGDGVFTWENENLVPTVGNSGYIVKFTPNDA
ncbi:MAG: X2-like carbohydrate binding domain-containing protein, partial [Oscillospiraceae bacterium]|nr:X2-like carbohydrate binding domain-containing protein [Oscillospiraceae bacterium]